MKLVHLVGFITKKFVTMHGHMNVKFNVLLTVHHAIILGNCYLFIVLYMF